MKLNLTIDQCLAFADEWSRGCTIHEGSQGWRVVCMLLAEEVRRLRGEPAGQFWASDQHDSDCATHNAPAYPNGPCDCSKRGDA